MPTFSDWQNQLLENQDEGEAGHAIGGSRISMRPPSPSLSRENRTRPAPFHLTSIPVPIDAKTEAMLGETAAAMRCRLPRFLLSAGRCSLAYE